MITAPPLTQNQRFSERAKRHYDALLRSGKATKEQLIEAAQAMAEAVREVRG
jgi:hypothetical protein